MSNLPQSPVIRKRRRHGYPSRCSPVRATDRDTCVMYAIWWYDACRLVSGPSFARLLKSARRDAQASVHDLHDQPIKRSPDADTVTLDELTTTNSRHINRHAAKMREQSQFKQGHEC